jgi:hypothetical protein
MEGFHHAYLAFLLMLVGFVALIEGKKTEKRKKIATVIILVGLIIFCDDVYQHYRQYDDPTYLSPLHQLYGATLYHIKLIRDLNTWMDKIFS